MDIQSSPGGEGEAEQNCEHHPKRTTKPISSHSPSVILRTETPRACRLQNATSLPEGGCWACPYRLQDPQNAHRVLTFKNQQFVADPALRAPSFGRVRLRNISQLRNICSAQDDSKDTRTGGVSSLRMTERRLRAHCARAIFRLRNISQLRNICSAQDDRIGHNNAPSPVTHPVTPLNCLRM